MNKQQSGTAVHVRTLGRLVLLLLVPVGTGLVMWQVAQLAEARSRWVEHTLDVELSLERLEADIKTAETNERGYLLTGEPRFLDGYRLSVSEANLELMSLGKATSDNSRQRQNLAEFKPLLSNRFSFLQSRIDAYGKSGPDFVGANIGMDQQRGLVSSMQSLLDKMRVEEERLRGTREDALKRVRSAFYWFLLVSYGLIAAVVASLYFSVRRHSILSATAQEDLSKLNAELDQKVKERTALLEAREELLNIFVQHVPAAVAMLDRDLRYLQVSDRWCWDFNISRERFAGNSHYDLFPEIPERWKDIHRRCLAGEMLRADEDPWIRGNGEVTWLRWEVIPWGSRDGLPEGMLIFSEDITSRRRIEQDLRESEATIRTLLDTASQAVLAVDSNGNIVLANRMVGQMFGYEPDELTGQQLEILLPAHLRDGHRTYREFFNEHPRTRAMGINLDLAGIRKDGSEFPIEVSLSSVETKKGLLAVSFVSDITARKQAEKKLVESEMKLRALAASLISAQEDERRSLARELHDDITQQLASLAIELGRLAQMTSLEDQQRARVEGLQNQTLRASKEVRRISHGLHPSVITDFGLSVALEEFCEEFAESQGVSVQFEPADDAELDDLAATCLYRVAQESLRNAVLHGRAKSIRVTLEMKSEQLELIIEDDGIGFKADTLSSRSGLGIVSMRERMRLINGVLTVESEPGRGARVVASVPIRKG